VTEDHSAARYLRSLAKRLTPERFAQVDAVLALELTGREPGQYTLDCRSPSGGGLLPGLPDAHGLTARTSARMDSDDFVRLARGKLKPHIAVLTGRMRLKGDLGLATRLGGLFAP
jgi:hypothetical protein